MQPPFFCSGPNPEDPTTTAAYRLSEHFQRLPRKGGPKYSLADLHTAKLVVEAPDHILQSHSGMEYLLVARPHSRRLPGDRAILANLRDIFVVAADRGLVISRAGWHAPYELFPQLPDRLAEIEYLNHIGRAVLRTP